MSRPGGRQDDRLPQREALDPLTTPIALLGGTFDPVHYGHLRFADAIRRQLGLPELRLVPARDPPHRAGPQAPAPDRLAMLELAVAEFPGLAVDPQELARAGKSYTVLTLEALRAGAPGRPLLLLLGADAFLGLPTWHRWHELFTLAHLVVVPRPGVTVAGALPAPLVPEWNARLTHDPAVLFSTPAGAIYEAYAPPQPISATAIRAALAQGPAGRQSIAQLMPRAVLAYIDQHGLYSTPPDAT